MGFLHTSRVLAVQPGRYWSDPWASSRTFLAHLLADKSGARGAGAQVVGVETAQSFRQEVEGNVQEIRRHLGETLSQLRYQEQLGKGGEEEAERLRGDRDWLIMGYQDVVAHVQAMDEALVPEGGPPPGPEQLTATDDAIAEIKELLQRLDPLAPGP